MPDLIGENNAPETPQASASAPDPAPSALSVAAPLPPVGEADAPAGGPASEAAPADGDAVPELVDPAAVLAAQAASNLTAARLAVSALPPADYSDHVPVVVGTADAPEPSDPELLAQSGDTLPADGTADPVGTHAPRLSALGENDAGIPTIDPLVDFIIGQLSPIEALGFLRGAIIWIAGRLGTPAAQPLDAERLDAFNLAFQYRLRDMKIQTDAQALAAKDKQVVLMAGADEDARLRGFESADQMQEELGALYASVEQRLEQWHAATAPGGDVTSAPDEQALLFDAYRITKGLARGKA